MDLKNKKVLVVGLGVSGEAAARLLLGKGASLWITEMLDNPRVRSIAEDLIKEGAVVEIGKHTEDLVRDKDCIVVSPGLHPNSEVIKWAKKYDTKIISELELASRYIKCPIIGVTGTNGKSTVTSLIDHIFRRAGYNSVACGNLGLSLSSVVLNNEKPDFAVVEISSFQLEYIESFRPTVSVWLNFSYDHLDHHASMEEYLYAKKRIFENQSEKDWAVINYREQDTVGVVKAKKIIYGKEEKGEWKWGGAQLKGAHNIENILAAVSVAKIYGITDLVIKTAIDSFEPLAHRIEYVASIDGVLFIDDSKATNVHAVIPAVSSFSRPVILILGGRDKGDDFARLKENIKEKVAEIIVMGEAKEKILKQLNGAAPITITGTLEDAVARAYEKAVPGTTVLFSPACSSFDMFRDYKERGNKFKEAVLRIKNENENYNLRGEIRTVRLDRMAEKMEAD